MRFFANTNIRFLEYRRVWLSVSLLLIALGLVSMIWGPGLKLGVDFSGGTQLTLKFKQEPDLARVRRALEALKLGEVTIQRFDEPELHEFLVRVQNPGREEDFSKLMVEALDREFNGSGSAELDLNTMGADALRDALAQADPDRVGGGWESRRAHYQTQATAVLQARKERGIFAGPANLDGVSALSPAVRSFLKERAQFGEFTVLAAEAVGPLVGKDLRKKAIQAVIFSLLGMMVYIWARFRLPYSIGAVAALFHDVLITLGALSVSGREINLPTVAALLTLVGYSVNDTVVIFDRIRERLKLERGKPLVDIMNRAINQTLSRTVITSGLTLLVVIALYLFGGDVINTFAFVLLVGIVVGTYSSIYIASPVALFLTQVLEKRRRQRTGR
ncbi:MAG: protein translocase subunit SecF [Thermoanaerobaculum sp.]|nr:protein translocase subunit SecF [Thermoanaerobaculum sp.]MDW7968718.1 protein translocase subunit SecF [Thermoanaerobaculum sp.]